MKIFPGTECVSVPVADGGEGTVDALLRAMGGQRMVAHVTGPMYEPETAVWGLLSDGTAVMEMAQASGLPYVPAEQKDPRQATSLGTGEMIAAAVRGGVRHILIGIGGSATNDGGMGMLTALGAKFTDKDGKEVKPIGGEMIRVEKADFSGLMPELKDTAITVICDVTNPLLGENGATFIYGPQKGAIPEIRDELEEGERLAAVETPIDDDKPMSRANRRMLLAILGAEFLWFMSDNALGTYIGNYVIYHLQSSSSATMVLTILGGLASVVGFAIAGGIAERIGRKWTISAGLAVTLAGLVVMCFVAPTGRAVGERGEFAFPTLLYAVWVLKGFGMALVHNCSFPMVVELCSSKKIGRFTGYYYAASMSAQTITPVLLGLVLNATLAWRTLPVYAAILTALSFCVFTALVKNIRASRVRNVTGIEAVE